VRGIGEAARLGFDAVELFYDGPGNGEVRRACRDSGLAVIFHPAYALKQNKLDLGDLDPGRRSAAVDRARAWIDVAAELGSLAVMVLSGSERSDERQRREAIAALRESLGTLCGHAAGAGMRLQLESFNNAGEPWLLMGPTTRCLDLAREVAADHPNFGLTFDLSHALQMGEDALRSLLSIRQYCSHVHLANCVIRDRADPLFGDKHPPFGHPGGEVDAPWLAGFVRGLREGGFFAGREVTVGAEVITRAPAEPVATAAAAKRELGSALAGSGKEKG
jgi:sugar phosphate isomerase/epimerase